VSTDISLDGGSAVSSTPATVSLTPPFATQPLRFSLTNLQLNPTNRIQRNPHQRVLILYPIRLYNPRAEPPTAPRYCWTTSRLRLWARRTSRLVHPKLLVLDFEIIEPPSCLSLAICRNIRPAPLYLSLARYLGSNCEHTCFADPQPASSGRRESLLRLAVPWGSGILLSPINGRAGKTP